MFAAESRTPLASWPRSSSLTQVSLFIVKNTFWFYKQLSSLETLGSIVDGETEVTEVVFKAPGLKRKLARDKDKRTTKQKGFDLELATKRGIFVIRILIDPHSRRQQPIYRVPFGALLISEPVLYLDESKTPITSSLSHRS